MESFKDLGAPAVKWGPLKIWVLLDTVSFFSWRSGLHKMYECLQGEAVLDSHEPMLGVRVTSRGQIGQIIVRVEISPNMEQGHWFEFAADQTFLPPIVAQCDALLERFPVLRPAERGV